MAAGAKDQTERVEHCGRDFSHRSEHCQCLTCGMGWRGWFVAREAHRERNDIAFTAICAVKA